MKIASKAKQRKGRVQQAEWAGSLNLRTKLRPITIPHFGTLSQRRSCSRLVWSLKINSFPISFGPLILDREIDGLDK